MKILQKIPPIEGLEFQEVITDRLPKRISGRIHEGIFKDTNEISSRVPKQKEFYEVIPRRVKLNHHQIQNSLGKSPEDSAGELPEVLKRNSLDNFTE